MDVAGIDNESCSGLARRKDMRFIARLIDCIPSKKEDTYTLNMDICISTSRGAELDDV